MKATVVLIMLLVRLIVSALNSHIIRLDESIRCLVEAEITFEEIYIGTRDKNKLKLLAQNRLIEGRFKDLPKQG